MQMNRIRRRGPAGKVLLAACATIALALAALLGGAAAPAGAVTSDDEVLDWNLYAAQALMNGTAATPPGAGQPPPVAVLHLGMVQAAVYDAVNMIDGGHEPYLDGLPDAPSTASKSNAVATAAHHVLVGMRRGSPGAALVLPPATIAWLDTTYNALGLSPTDPGVVAGAAAAAAMLAARDDDGRFMPGVAFTEGLGVGDWRPTPPGFVNDPNAWVARVDPFAMKSASQFRTPGPRKIGTQAYRAEYNEVKDLGGNGTTTLTERTAEQTAMAMFFVANPVEMFNRTFRSIATREGLTLAEQARMFAMLNVAGADAAIACWDDKEFWHFWRPITAIREDDGDPKTTGAPDWASLGASPPYPDHPSGYNCQSGAFMHTAKSFFGRDLPVDLTAGSVTREYDRFTDVIDDTIDARLYLGIHFRSADVDGAWIGKRTANWVHGHHFGPSRD